MARCKAGNILGMDEACKHACRGMGVQVLAEVVALQQQAAAAQEGGIGRFFKQARPPAAVAPSPALVATS
jgi:hypothetical protein